MARHLTVAAIFVCGVAVTVVGGGAGASAVGTRCTPKWVTVSDALGARRDTSRDAIEAVAARDVWTVGVSEGRPFAEHWDGVVWTVASSAGAGGRGSLFAVASDSSTDVWAVGTRRGPGSTARNRTLVERWDGTKWTIIPSPNGPFRNSDLTGVTAIAPDDVWAVGSTWDPDPVGQVQELHRSRPLILHWDGTRWSVTVQYIRGGLSAIASVGQKEVWATGEGPDFGSTRTSGLTEHWNGISWKVIIRRYATPDKQNCLNCFVDFIAVAGTAPDDVWAGGFDELQQTYVMHWNGKAWVDVKDVLPARAWPSIRGFAVFGKDDMWVAGYTLIERWNGKRWSLMRDAAIKTGVTAVGGIAPDDVWVGTNSGFAHYGC
jgi:hypothetical protein